MDGSFVFGNFATVQIHFQRNAFGTEPFLVFLFVVLFPPLASPHIPVHNGKRNHRKASGHQHIAVFPHVQEYIGLNYQQKLYGYSDVGKASKNIAFNVHGRLLLLMVNYPARYSAHRQAHI